MVVCRQVNILFIWFICFIIVDIENATMQDKKGKRRAIEATELGPDERAMEVLLELLGKSLCRRSSTHLEQVLQLLVVVLQAAHAALMRGARDMLIRAEAKRLADARREERLEALRKTQEQDMTEGGLTRALPVYIWADEDKSEPFVVEGRYAARER